MNHRVIIPYWAISSFCILTLIFLFFPNIDLLVSSLFFDDGKFPLSGKYTYSVSIIDKFIQFGGIFAWVSSIGYLICKDILTNGLNLNYRKHQLIYISLVGLIGSFGIVHWLKRYIMRCRPMYIDVFGGDMKLTNVWTKNYEFINNNGACWSFVSGHSAIGFLVYAIAFLYPANHPKRFQYIVLGSITGLIAGAIRIIQGKHYLSDVLFSGYVVYFTAFVMAILMKPHQYMPLKESRTV